MPAKTRGLTLENAPLQYAPTNELGVVFLFSHVAKRLQFRIESIQQGFPDCTAYRRSGNKEKLVRIEFEFRSSNFRAHKHDPKGCEAIVCWENDWPDAPPKLEIIELKRYFGAARKVWIQPVIRSQCHNLDERAEMHWGLSKRASPGDLLLMYRCSPHKAITDIYVLIGRLARGTAGWRDGECYFGNIKRLCSLLSPIFLEDLRNHRILKTASFVRRSMQGNHLVSQYWHHLYEMIVKRNPSVRKKLKDYQPEKL